ncbi:MAG: TonB-dependent receptor [Ignavibacteriae bacterium]|nr:TonB-dependent receptor [Ignavibacteriota bacterium]
MIKHISVFFSILFLGGFLHAGTKGILDGKVIDKDTDDPLIGVSVLIIGTSIGAATDVEGRFMISNVDAGTYDVRFTSVGYQSTVMRGVVIRPDLRTTLTVTLSQSTLELKEMEITAERPLIEKDVTSTNFSYGGSQVEKLPVRDVQELMSLFPSVTAEGNVRGGKASEVVYLVDGLPLQNVISGGMTSSLPKSSITEFSVQTGGYEAEYGNALSGIVNIITKRGNDRHSSILRIEKDNWLAGDWNSQHNKTTEAELTLSGPIVREQLHYFSANTYHTDDTRWWQDFTKFFDSPITNDFSGMTKLDYGITSKMRLSAQTIYSFRKWKDYEFSWRFNLDGLPGRSRTSDRTSILFSHTLSDDVHYSLNLSYSYLFNSIGDGDKNSLDLTPYNYDFFLQYVVSGNRAWWAETKQNIMTAKGDLVIQPNPLNLLKFGFEINQYDIFSDLVKYEPQRTYFGKILVDEPLLNFSTSYQYYPRSGAIYLQDKLQVEADGATVNLGFRWDFLDPSSERPVVENVLVDSANGQYQTQLTKFVKASMKQQLSPRMGLSFPLTWNVLVVMNYGHYFQFPLFDYLYSGINPSQLRSGVNVLVGNPDLKPERTHAWEIGFKYGFDEKDMVSLTYFKKEFIDQIDSKTFLASKARSAGDYGFAEYVNNAFANAEGIEVVFMRHRSEDIAGSIGYTLMRTEGVSDYVDQGINLHQWGFPVANTPYPLSWDQTHSLKIELDLNLPFDISGNIMWSYSTGKPYTYFPTRDGFTALDTTRVFIPNNERLPSSSTLNMKFSKRLLLTPGTALMFYGSVNNLFNSFNARWADANGKIGGQLADPSAYYELRRVAFGIKYEM